MLATEITKLGYRIPQQFTLVLGEC